MHLDKIFEQKKFFKSFEVFPPGGELGYSKAKAILDELAPLNPDFISVTCGAGGTLNKDNTIKVADMIKNEYGIEPLAHFTCLTLSKEMALERLAKLKECNIKNILALRGDRRLVDNNPDDFKYAKDLISLVNKQDFCVMATCYPEAHMDCDDIDTEILHTKIKAECGASMLISQICYDNNLVYPYIEKLRKAGVDTPFIAGVMPILSKTQVERMVFMCGVSLPSKVVKILHKYQDNKDDLIKAGIEYAKEQVIDLKAHGVDGIHIYTMNNPTIAKELSEVIDD